jgi:hypothetical protein
MRLGRALIGHAGVGDENVDMTELFVEIGGGLFYGGAIGDIELQGERLVALARPFLRGALHAIDQVRQDDSSAQTAESLGDRASDSSGGAGHETGFTFERIAL